jgi:hypothetical protein
MLSRKMKDKIGTSDLSASTNMSYICMAAITIWFNIFQQSL